MHWLCGARQSFPVGMLAAWLERINAGADLIGRDLYCRLSEAVVARLRR